MHGKIIVKKNLILFASLWLICCGQANQGVALFEEPVENDSIPVIDFSDLDLDQVPKFSDIFDSISFVKLETREDALIGKIDKIIAVGDKFVILDTSLAKAVFVFDSEGRFLNRIGRSGRGPQEYDLPTDMAYDKYNDEIIINNNNRQTLMCFKLDGTFVKEIQLDFYFCTLSIVDSNTIAIYRNNRGRGEDDYNLVLIDREGNVKNQFLPIDRATDLLSPPCQMAFFSYGDSLQFSPMYSRTVYNLDENGLIPKYRLDFGKRNIPYGLLKGITNRDIDNKIRESRNYIYANGFSETPDHLIFQLANYNRLAYDCYYSKTSGKYVAGSIFVNDMYGLVTTGILYCANGDLLVSAIESSAFLGAKKTVEEMFKRKSNPQETKLEESVSKTDDLISNEKMRNVIKALESTDFTISQEEADFINSINETDNPVLRIARLKKF